jgi:acetyl esterase
MTAHQVQEGRGTHVTEQPDWRDAGWLAEVRAGTDAFAVDVSVREPVDQVVDDVLDLGDRVLPLRSYGTGDRLLVWFHGGGYVTGSLEAIDPTCRALRNRSGWSVLSVGYRLAPEHPFPMAYDDALAALQHASTQAPVVAVGGDSAGGGLAAAVARATAETLAALVLLCPWLDGTGSSPSVVEKAADHGLTAAALTAFMGLYGGDPTDPRVSPLLTPDLSGMPMTLVVTAEHDPLRDEGELFAARIVAAGGAAEARRWDGMIHGFPGMTAEAAEAEQALTWVADRLRDLPVAQAAPTR